MTMIQYDAVDLTCTEKLTALLASLVYHTKPKQKISKK